MIIFRARFDTTTNVIQMQHCCGRIAWYEDLHDVHSNVSKTKKSNISRTETNETNNNQLQQLAVIVIVNSGKPLSTMRSGRDNHPRPTMATSIVRKLEKSENAANDKNQHQRRTTTISNNRQQSTKYPWEPMQKKEKQLIWCYFPFFEMYFLSFLFGPDWWRYSEKSWVPKVARMKLSKRSIKTRSVILEMC